MAVLLTKPGPVRPGLLAVVSPRSRRISYPMQFQYQNLGPEDIRMIHLDLLQCLALCVHDGAHICKIWGMLLVR
jgi:hypothetical protein